MSRGYRRVLASALTLTLPGCFSPVGSVSSITDSDADTTATTGTTASTSSTTGTTDATQTSASAVTTGTTAAPDTSTSTGTTDSAAVTTGPAQCGDGVVAGDEACDDGPANGDAQPCRGDCTLAVCGDGQLCGACEPAEVCDDGNQIDDDACDLDCQPTDCGDGLLLAKQEECDDGNQLPGDGCSPRCLLEHQLIFVSSVKVPADFADLAAVDQLCAGLAATRFNLRREFVAWMSVADTPASSRIGLSVFPYLTPQGELIATSTQDLLDGTLLAPVLEHEDGALQPFSPLCDGVSAVWTGTTALGGVGAKTCTDWSTTGGEGLSGNFGLADAGWTDACNILCNSALRVYCVEKAQ